MTGIKNSSILLIPNFFKGPKEEHNTVRKYFEWDSFLEDRILNAFGINSSFCEDDSSDYKSLFIIASV